MAKITNKLIRLVDTYQSGYLELREREVVVVRTFGGSDYDQMTEDALRFAALANRPVPVRRK